MLRFTLSLLVALAVAGPLAAQDEVTLRTVRYFRADDGQTRVMALISVPYAMLQPAAASSEPMLAYAVSLRVLDSTGLSLLGPEPHTWQQRVPATARVPGANGLELIEFAVAPGTYRLHVVVRDSVSGVADTAEASFDGFREAPRASDLLLSPAMRLVSASDSLPRAGEIRRGNTLLIPALELRLTPVRTRAFYFMEAYTGAETETAGTTSVSVLDSTGKTLFQSQPGSVRLAPGGGVLKGQLDLDGLPEGRYTMKVTVAVDGETVERSATLSMAGLEETMAQVAATGQTAPSSDEAFFGAMDEAQLDSFAEPMSLLPNSGELRNFDELSVSAKRRFLTEYWQKLDPDSATARNEARERFYDAIRYANQQFQVGSGRQEPGWRTDRGRIYTRNGAPDDILRRVQAGSAAPYEVWRYTRGRSRYYVFADQTGFGAYKLILTNDNRETGLPSWRDIISEEGVRDVGFFLGIDFYGSSGGGF